MKTLGDSLEEFFMDKGIEKGQRTMLLGQLRERFGELPKAVESRVNAAGAQTLETWALRVLHASTLDEVLATS